MYKIYTSGNTFYVEEVATGLLHEGHSKDVLLLRKTVSGTIFSFKNINNWSINKVLDFSTDVDLTGAPYSDWTTFIDWTDSELGKSNPQVSGLISGNIVDSTDPNNIIINETITTLVASGNTATYTSEDGTTASLVLGDRYRTDSITSNTITTHGQLTFLADTGLSYISKQDVIIVYDSLNNMQGEVVSYDINTGSMVVDIKHKEGSGTYSTWEINLDGIVLEQVKDWGYYKDNWSVEPLFNSEIAGGEVYSYVLDGTTRYRFVPEPYDATLDAFYENFSEASLTNLIVSRG